MAQQDNTGSSSTASDSLGWFDAETEILAGDGWRRFNSLGEGTEVLTRDTDDRTTTYEAVSNVECRLFAGELYHQENQSLDFAVTPDHSIYTQKVNSNNSGADRYGGLRKRSIEDVLGKPVVYDTGFNWCGERVEEFELPGTDDCPSNSLPMDLWLRFFGWYIAEGYVKQRNDRPNNYRVGLSQNTDSDHTAELEETLSELASILAIKFTTRDEGDVFRFELFDKQLATYLDTFGKSREKSIPPFLKRLHEQQLHTLLSALIKGDGQQRPVKRESMRYFTRSSTLADDVQELALKCGYASNVSYQSKYDRYVVGITEAPRVHVNHGEPTGKFVKHSGTVWNVTVPGDDLIFVRRNGKPLWSGSSH